MRLAWRLRAKMGVQGYSDDTRGRGRGCGRFRKHRENEGGLRAAKH